MKRIVSMLMALLFLLGACAFAAEEEQPVFSGLVTDVVDNSVTVINAFGTTLTFAAKDENIPEIGSLVDIEYSGDVATIPVLEKFTVVTPATVKTVSGTVEAVESTCISVKPVKGTAVSIALLASTTVSGKAETYKVGDTVTVTYAECVQFMTNVDLALNIEVTKVAQEKKTETTTNRKATGVVVSINDGGSITIRTSKGKKYTFKINSRTSFPSSKYLEEGCTVTVYYDGNPSKRPYAKKIKVTKTPEETERGKTYKKSGTVEFFGGMEIGLTNGFHADLLHAKHSGKGAREPGRKVTVYYYTQNGLNYATKVKWK